MKKFLLVLLLCPLSALAAWSGSGKMNAVYSHNGYIIIDTTITGNGCGDAGKFWWPTSDDDSDEMYSMALAALASQATVNVLYDEASPAANCRWSGDLMTHMRIGK